MKKIHFEKLDSLQNQLLLFPMAICIGLFSYMTLTGDKSAMRQVAAILGFGLLIFSLGKPFFYKNYVGWNRKGVMIKLNSFFPKNINFKQVREHQITDTRLEIHQRNGRQFKFDLSHMDAQDIDKIRKILNSN